MFVFSIENTRYFVIMLVKFQKAFTHIMARIWLASLYRTAVNSLTMSEQ
jgi:hypothetical protein